MTHQSNSQERCPRCGGRDLQHERVRSQEIRIVSCLDCDAVFELPRSSGMKPAKRYGREQDWQEKKDKKTDTDDREEELDYSDR